MRKAQSAFSNFRGNDVIKFVGLLAEVIYFVLLRLFLPVYRYGVRHVDGVPDATGLLAASSNGIDNFIASAWMRFKFRH